MIHNAKHDAMKKPTEQSEVGLDEIVKPVVGFAISGIWNTTRFLYCGWWLTSKDAIRSHCNDKFIIPSLKTPTVEAAWKICRAEGDKVVKVRIDVARVKSDLLTVCKFGTGKQDMKTCRMIYIHWPGYYPTDESYQFALAHLCPNLRVECLVRKENLMQDMTPLFKEGQQVRLIKDRDNCGVEGFDVGKIYKIESYRLRNDIVQYFFEDNVHAYYAECFDSV